MQNSLIILDDKIILLEKTEIFNSVDNRIAD